jgi:hypothetical protein
LPAPAPQASAAVRWMPRLRAWSKRLAKWIGWGVAALGTLVTVLSLLPQLSISAEAPMRPLEPLSSPFILTNTGLVPTQNVGYSCVLHRVVGHVPGSRQRGIILPTALIAPEEMGWLQPSESVMLTCANDEQFGPSVVPIDSVSEAVVSIFVVYVPWLLPRRGGYFWRNKIATFRLFREPGGGFRWVPVPTALADSVMAQFRAQRP